MSGTNQASGTRTATAIAAARRRGCCRVATQAQTARNGQTSGRSSAAAVPRPSTQPRRSSSAAQTAPRTSATSSGSESPPVNWRSGGVKESQVSATEPAATAAATQRQRPVSSPLSRAASSPASSGAQSQPARAISSQACGAAPPSSESGAQIRTGSGFHDGPEAVSKPPCSSSRPQISQAQGS